MKFRDKMTGEIVDVGDAKGEQAWQQLEFKVGTPQAPMLRTFRFKDKETGEEVSALGHSQDEALRAIEEMHHTQIPDQHFTLLEAALQGISAVPESAKATAVSMAQPFMHPEETAKAFKNLTFGILQMTGMKTGEEYIPYAQAVGKYLDQRYGSWDNVKRTLAQDPVGMLADISMVIPGAAPASVGLRAATIPGRVARGTVAAGKSIAKSNLPQTVKGIAKQYPLATAAAKKMTGTTGKVVGAMAGLPYAASAAGHVAGMATAHWPITALAVLGYSKAAQKIASTAAKGAERTTPLPYGAGRIKEQQPSEAGGPEGGQRTGVPRITVTPRPGYAQEQPSAGYPQE